MAPPSHSSEGGMLPKLPPMAHRREHSYSNSNNRHPAKVVDAEEHGDNVPHRRQISHGEEEGVEVVLSARGSSRVVDPASTKSRHAPDQNVFRPPPPHAVRPRAVRPQSGGPQPQPYMHASGSFGAYGPPPPPPPRGDYPPPPYPVPYNPSGSFDDGSYHHQQSHYSPHVQYPPPNSATMYPNEDVNVISPNHKGDPQYRPPTTPRQRYAPPPPHYYQYPPASPVSRPGAAHSNSPPRGRGGHYGGVGAGRRHYHGPPPGHDGPYADAQRGGEMYHPDDGTWNAFPSSGSQPPLVTESSFDSEHFPPGPGGPPQSMGPPPPHHHPGYDPHQQFYGGGGSWGSFDSAPVPPPPHFDDYRYYGYPSPYPPYPQYPTSGGYYGDPYQGHYGERPPYEDDEHLLKDYHPDRDGEDMPNAVTPGDKSGGDTPIASNTSSSGMVLPKAAYEIDFDVFDPPLEPILPPSNDPICDSPAEVNSYDVLCGRGGGTNSQIGNRRFRKLVQEFQPTYLLARRKEKPLLARTIVLIIRKRGGRFLKKDEETGELFEVGDSKAEAKTSQALREGLDVRATKTAASSLVDKKKKKKGSKSKETEAGEEDEDESSKKSPPPEDPSSKADDEEEEEEEEEQPVVKPPESPPTLPRLQGEEGSKSGLVHPHSPETIQFRKRRRMRSGGCDPFNDRLFPEFCPPRADLARTSSPTPDDGTAAMDLSNTPLRRNTSHDDSIHVDNESVPAPGCAGIALDLMGVATGSFCLGPTRWRSG